MLSSVQGMVTIVRANFRTNSAHAQIVKHSQSLAAIAYIMSQKALEEEIVEKRAQIAELKAEAAWADSKDKDATRPGRS